MTSNAGKKVKSCETTNNRPERPARRQAAAANTAQEVLMALLCQLICPRGMAKVRNTVKLFAMNYRTGLCALLSGLFECGSSAPCCYSAEDISDAKRIQLHEFQSQLINYSFATERRSSSGRAAHEAEVEDIVGIFDVVDVRSSLEN